MSSAQQNCQYCGKVTGSSNALWTHIVFQHPDQAASGLQAAEQGADKENAVQSQASPLKLRGRRILVEREDNIYRNTTARQEANRKENSKKTFVLYQLTPEPDLQGFNENDSEISALMAIKLNEIVGKRQSEIDREDEKRKLALDLSFELASNSLLESRVRSLESYLEHISRIMESYKYKR